MKWTNYWQICRTGAVVAAGQRLKVPLVHGREVEINLATSGCRTVIAWERGKEVSRSTVPIGEAITVVGGRRDEKSAWFILVRRVSGG
jgi:hypothetical protein